MKCPCFGKTLIVVDNVVFTNVDRYDNFSTMLTTCCNKIIGVSLKKAFHLSDMSHKSMDDWGNTPEGKK